jgi:hypothetical protein
MVHVEGDDFSDDFVRQRNNFHEASVTQLSSHRTKNTGAAWRLVFVDQHDGVAVELDVTSIGATRRLLGADDHSTDNRFLLDVAARDYAFDATYDDVTKSGNTATATAEHLDAHHLPGAGIVGYIKSGFLLDHVRTCAIKPGFAAR